jgi:hypothetical protein
MQQWLNRHWVAAALCMAIVLALLMPILAEQRPSAWLLIFAMLPAYMFHQVEEHAVDRFRVFVNQRVFHGVEALYRGSASTGRRADHLIKHHNSGNHFD